MSKSLVIIRHAKAVDADSIINDFERTLNDKGRKNAQSLGTLLLEKGLKLDFILTSSALRTLETAQIIAKLFKMDSKQLDKKEEMYSCHIHDLMTIVHGLNKDFSTVALVGHNPIISDFASYLTGKSMEFATSGFAKVDFEVDSWALIDKNNGIIDYSEI